jgi:hypothetical protein
MRVNTSYHCVGAGVCSKRQGLQLTRLGFGCLLVVAVDQETLEVEMSQRGMDPKVRAGVSSKHQGLQLARLLPPALPRLIACSAFLLHVSHLCLPAAAAGAASC